MKRYQKLTLTVRVLLAMISLGYGQLLVKSSSGSLVLHANAAGQVGIGTTLLNSDKLTVGGSEQVNGALTVSGTTSLTTLRIAGNEPAAGKILTSNDNLGNAVWRAPRTVAAVKVYYAGAAGQPIPPDDKTAGEVKVNFDMKEWDAGNDFNLANDWFLVPRTGCYVITSTVCIRYIPSAPDINVGTSLFLSKIPNGSTTEERVAQGSGELPRDNLNLATVVSVVELQAGDKLFVKAQKNWDTGFDIFSPVGENRKSNIYLSIREL